MVVWFFFFFPPCTDSFLCTHILHSQLKSACNALLVCDKWALVIFLQGGGYTHKPLPSLWIKQLRSSEFISPACFVTYNLKARDFIALSHSFCSFSFNPGSIFFLLMRNATPSCRDSKLCLSSNYEATARGVVNSIEAEKQKKEAVLSLSPY